MWLCNLFTIARRWNSTMFFIWWLMYQFIKATFVQQYKKVIILKYACTLVAAPLHLECRRTTTPVYDVVRSCLFAEATTRTRTWSVRRVTTRPGTRASGRSVTSPVRHPPTPPTSTPTPTRKHLQPWRSQSMASTRERQAPHSETRSIIAQSSYMDMTIKCCLHFIIM